MGWKLTYRKQYSKHQRDRPLFLDASNGTAFQIYIKTCGALLKGAIEASFSIGNGAGGFFLGHPLQSRYVVFHESPAFRAVRSLEELMCRAESLEE